MQLIFRSLTAPQRPTRLLLPRRPTLRFWCLTPKGARVRVCEIGGELVRGIDIFVCYSHILLHACLHFRYALYYMCACMCDDLWDMLTYHYIYISCLICVVHLLCFRHTPMLNEHLLSCTRTYFLYIEYMLWTWYAWTCSNPCDLIATSSCKPSGWKPQISFLHILEVVLSSITKKGEIESI